MMALPPEREICIIGAGFAGICVGVQLKEQLNLNRFTIFESNSEVGGTWLVNNYPGCECDVPSHLYSLSFAPRSDWSKVFSSQSEILKYLKDVTSDYNLYPHIRFNMRVETLVWDEVTHKWIAIVYDKLLYLKEIHHFDLVINGTGTLRIPNYPEEFHKFTGQIMHSAEWDHSIDLSGKRVGVVGTGASGVQIGPAIVDKVEKLYVFQRNAPYIMPRLQFKYPKMAKWAFKYIPGVRRVTRAITFWLRELLHLGFRHNTIYARVIGKISALHRRLQIRSDALLQQMTPEYEFGCKRILPSNDYYPALQRSNCEVISNKIVRVDGNVMYTENGNAIFLDVLVLATGYKPHEYFSPMTIIGKNGEDILDTWRTYGPRTYLGTVSTSLPNYFTILGPGTALGHSSTIFVIECQTNWVLKVIKAMQKRNASYVNVKPEPESEYMDFIENAHKSTVWGNASCGSWYVDPNGKITTLWPGNLLDFWKLTRTLNTEMLEFK